MLYPVMYRVSLEVVISASLLAYLQIRKSTFKIGLTYSLKTKTSAKDSVLLSLFMRTKGKCNDSHALYNTGLNGIVLSVRT